MLHSDPPGSPGHPQPLASLEGSLQLSQALSSYPRGSTLLGAQLGAWFCFTPRIKDSRTCGVLGAEGSMCVCACARALVNLGGLLELSLPELLFSESSVSSLPKSPSLFQSPCFLK